jgi:hypothetical protein
MKRSAYRDGPHMERWSLPTPAMPGGSDLSISYVKSATCSSRGGLTTPPEHTATPSPFATAGHRRSQQHQWQDDLGGWPTNLS